MRAVDGVSFDVAEGETLGLVGESGSGKSTTGYCILQLMKPTSGSVRFEGTELIGLGREAMRKMRREMQIVFQDPYSSLDPRMTVGDIVGEPLVVHGIGSRRDRGARIRELLDVVGFNPSYTNRYPHEFSGGQRQRIGIARALALSPKLIVCDEPVSALDVSIQAQILNLLKDLQRDFGLTYLFIAHDLAVVRSMSDRIAVMNKGQLVEIEARRGGLHEPAGRLHEGAPLRGADPGPARDEGAQGRAPQAAARTRRRRIGLRQTASCGSGSGRRPGADVASSLPSRPSSASFAFSEPASICSPYLPPVLSSATSAPLSIPSPILSPCSSTAAVPFRLNLSNRLMAAPSAGRGIPDDLRDRDASR